MKVCITGITGLLGSNLAYILRDVHEIIGIDRHDFNMEKVENVVLDIKDLKKLDEVVSDIMPDVLIHCLAEVNIDSCENKREDADFVNVSITEQLIRSCQQLGCKFIFVSTDAVFDGRSNQLYKEEDKSSPINHYGETKVEGEEITLSVENNLVLRTNIFGINMRDKMSLSEWVISSLKQNQDISMFEDSITSPILVNEFARVLMMVLEEDLSGVYNLVSTGAISKYEFGVSIKELFGITEGKIEKISIDEFGFKAKRGKNLSLDNGLLSNRLNVTIQTPMEGLVELKELYKSGYDGRLKKCVSS